MLKNCKTCSKPFLQKVCVAVFHLLTLFAFIKLVNGKDVSTEKVLNLSQTTDFLNSSKLKQSADENFKSDENSRKFIKGLEKTVGKGEIARYEQFLLFPQCFQKACFPGHQKVSLYGNGLI